ncbi:MAG TPA: hypothetical protein VIM00_14100 [Candidatus Acidoferrum sp.]
MPLSAVVDSTNGNQKEDLEEEDFGKQEAFAPEKLEKIGNGGIAQERK